MNLQYYIRQTKTEIKKRNKTIRTTLALNLANYHLKFVTLITNLFPMLHFQLFWEHYKCNIGKRWARMIKFKNKTNIKCYNTKYKCCNTNAITTVFSILLIFNYIHVQPLLDQIVC